MNTVDEDAENIMHDGRRLSNRSMAHEIIKPNKCLEIYKIDVSVKRQLKLHSTSLKILIKKKAVC